MSVTLNPAGLEALFHSVPVVAFVEREAQKVVDAAQGNVRDYFASAPTLTVDQDVALHMDGNKAVIGIRDAGEKSRRLARAQRDGRVNWLTRALSGS